MTLMDESSIDSCLLRASQQSSIAGVGTGVICSRTEIIGEAEHIRGEERLHCPQDYQTFPTKVDALRTWKALEGAFEEFM
jgi:hypothetical protein